MYSGALKVRTTNKTFTLLLRGECNDSSATCTDTDTYTHTSAVLAPPHSSKDGATALIKLPSPPPYVTQTVYSDPLMLKQQWMKEWLNRSGKKNTDIPPASLFIDQVACTLIHLLIHILMHTFIHILIHILICFSIYKADWIAVQ